MVCVPLARFDLIIVDLPLIKLIVSPISSIIMLMFSLILGVNVMVMLSLSPTYISEAEIITLLEILLITQVTLLTILR